MVTPKDFQKKFGINKYKIYHSRHWIWSLRPHQSTCASGIVSLKRECPTLAKVKSDEFNDLKNIVVVIESTLKDIFNYDVINYLMLMMVDKHVHFHIFPRYKHKINFLNETWIDKNWPDVPDILGPLLAEEKLQIINSHIKSRIKIKGNTNQ